MPISNQEASAALASVDQTARRAAVLNGYESGAPHLFLWGLIWIVGYGLGAFKPEWDGAAWLLLDFLGFVGSYALGRRAATRRTNGACYAMVYVAGTGALIALAAAIIVVMQPHTSNQVAALPALLIATAYGVTGIFRGARWAIVGIVLGALTVGGFLLLEADYMLWMSAVGGGALLLGGFWLRSA